MDRQRPILSWAAAFSGAEAYPDKKFPVTEDDAHCVLCQQALSGGAIDRRTRFLKFMEAATQTEAENAETVFNDLVKGVEGLQIETRCHVDDHHRSRGRSISRCLEGLG